MTREEFNEAIENLPEDWTVADVDKEHEDNPAIPREWFND